MSHLIISMLLLRSTIGLKANEVETVQTSLYKH